MPPPSPLSPGSHGRPLFWLTAAFVLAAALPLGGYRPLPWSLNAVVAGTLLAAWAWPVLRGRRPVALPLGRIAFPTAIALALLGWMLVQSLYPMAQRAAPVWAEVSPLLGAYRPTPTLGVQPASGLDQTLRFATHLAVFFLALQLGHDRHLAERAIRALALAIGAYAGYGLAMHLGGFNLVLGWERWAYTDSVTGTFVNRNHFATFCGLGMLCGVTLLTRALLASGQPVGRREWLFLLADLLERQWALLLVTCLSLAGLTFSHSRAGLASATAGVGVLLAASYLVHTRGRRSASAHKAYLTVGAILTVLLLAYGGGTLARVGDWLHSGESRIALFGRTLDGIADAPLTGHGAGAFGDVFRMYRNAALAGDLEWRHAHNSYLEFAFELGMPALIALLSLYGWLAVRFVKALGERRRDHEYAMLGLAALGLVGLHAMADFSVQLPGVAMPFAFLLGIACAQSWPSPRRSRRPAGPAVAAAGPTDA